MADFRVPSSRREPPKPENIKFMSCRREGCGGNQVEMERLGRGRVRFRCLTCGHTWGLNVGHGVGADSR